MLSFTGLLALLFVIIVLISPLRLGWFERHGLKIKKIYQVHHLMAWLFLVVVTIHFGFVFYYQKLSPEQSSWSTIAVNLVNSSLNIAGLIAYILFLIVAITAFFSNLSRNTWLSLHRLGFVATASLAVHLAYAWFYRIFEATLFLNVIRWSLLLGLFFVTIALILHVFYPDWISSKK